MLDNRSNLLISILLDKTASLSERDDAAMDLAECDDEKSLEALIKICKDPSEPDLWNVCGESVATIMVRTGKINWELINSFFEKSKKSAKRYIEAIEAEENKNLS